MNAPSREEWLRRRAAGIGGSDVPAILGLSPWRTALDIYLSKIEPPEEKDLGEPAYWGNVLEDVVAREYAMRTGNRVQRINGLVQRPDRPWMIANLDRTIVTPGTRARLDDTGQLRGIDGLLECKTANAFAASDWGADGDDEAIPTHYAAQGTWYLAVTGAPWIDFACLLGGQKFLVKRLHRDEEVIAAITLAAQRFWHEHVLARVPPPPQTASDVAKLWPQDNGQAIEADEQLLVAYNEARALRERIEADEKVLEGHVNAIKTRLGEASALTLGGKPIVTYKKAADSQRTDWKASADQIKGWLIEQGIEGGVDAVRDIINRNTETVKGSRRFLFTKQK